MISDDLRYMIYVYLNMTLYMMIGYSNIYIHIYNTYDDHMIICSALVTTCHHYGWRLDESRCTQQCEASVPSFNALLHPDPPARRHRRIHIDPDQLP